MCKNKPNTAKYNNVFRERERERDRERQRLRQTERKRDSEITKQLTLPVPALLQ